MPRKCEADGHSQSCNAGPSGCGDDAIGTVVVIGDPVQRRKLARHLRQVEDDLAKTRGSRAQGTRQAVDSNYVAAIAIM